MKRILIVLLGCSLLLGMAAAAQAASIAIGGLAGGEYWEEDTFMEDGIDADGFFIQGDFMLGEHLKLGLDYQSGETDSGYTKYSYLEADLGLRLLDGDLVWDLYAGYLRSEFYSYLEAENVVLGTDLTYNFSERFSLGATLKRSIWSDDDIGFDDFLTKWYSLNATLMLNENLGFTLGYVYTEHGGGWLNNFGVEGYTAGLVLKF